ncbi:MAG: amidohydrolase [Oscillospiraceae bacterium]|nr:amidohydrolase [Oscillospiraceae bacterium]
MQVILDRRALHAIPELGMELPKTAAYVKTALKDLNCQVFSPLEYAVCAYFDFGAPSAIAFRADMDALPITEETGLPFASTHEGQMHACGHDGHTAILLELARRLHTKNSLPHNVLLIFQPAEETTGGAEPICETGVLEQYGVKTVFGLHLWPGLEQGIVHTRENELMSRGSEVTVEIFGKSTHISNAAAGIDATAAAVEFYRQVRQAEAALPETVYRVLNFGMFTSGTVRNALSAYACLEGSLRAFRNEDFEGLQQTVYEIAAKVEAQFGCTVKIHYSESYPAVMNDPALVQRVYRAAPFRRLEKPSMASEDFAQYQLRTGGVFFFLGTGDTPALHATTFNFDEEILLKGADYFEQLAENFQ